MHDPERESESHTQVARTRTRASVHQGRQGAHPPFTTTTESVRSALDVARQRWASVTPEATQDTPERSDDSPETPTTEPTIGDAPTAPQTPAADPGPAAPEHPLPFNSWSGNSLPLRATWATYCDGARRVIESSPVLVIGYWAVGLPLFAIHSLARLSQDSTTSVTRGLVFVVVVVILIVGIAIAL